MKDKIQQIYDNTNKTFKQWSESNDIFYRNAACPETLRNNGKDKPSKIGDPYGFSILWTPVRKEPTFLFCGLCVTSFGSIKENGEFLKGIIPNKNIYMNSNHKFGQNIELFFKINNSIKLFENCVGLNLWHFQYVGSPHRNVYHDEVRNFCEKNTLEIIKVINPKYIISLHSLVYPKLKKSFSNVKKLSHPSFQNGIRFKEEMTEILKSDKINKEIK